jgi:hypothetical protein
MTGDLIEQCELGRSRWWLWKQLAAIVIVRAATTASANKLVTIRGVLLGWAVLAMWAALLNTLETQVSVGVLMPMKFWWWQHVGLPVEPLAIVAVACVAGWSSGRCVARFHRPVELPVVVVFLATYLLDVVGSLAWFGTAIVRDPHHYASSEWLTVSISITSGLIVLPVAIAAGAFQAIDAEQ